MIELLKVNLSILCCNYGIMNKSNFLSDGYGIGIKRVKVVVYK